MRLSGRLSLPLLLVLKSTLASASAGLILEKVGPVTNPGAYDLSDPEHGDVPSMDHCTLVDGTLVTVKRDYDAYVDVITIAGHAPPIIFKGFNNSDRLSLDCDRQARRFFYASGIAGTITAYSISGAREWEAQLAPFRRIPHKDERPDVDASGKHCLTGLQVRGRYILVEWTEIENGRRFALYTTDGTLVESFGPTTFLLRSAAKDEDAWELLWGTGLFMSRFIPEAVYRLRMVDSPAESSRPAAVIARLAAESSANVERRAAELSTTPLWDHALALLWTPTATAKTGIDFCGGTAPALARVWLGRDYDPGTAKQAKNLLVAVLIKIDRDLREQGAPRPRDPFHWLFETRARADPNLANLLDKFNPTNAAWDSEFRPLALEILTGYPGVMELAEDFKPTPVPTIKVFKTGKP